MTFVPDPPLPGVIVDPGGTEASVTITSSPSGATPTVYADPGGVTTVTMPKTITSAFTFYVPGPGSYTINGVTLTLEGNQVATVNLIAGSGQWQPAGDYSIEALASTSSATPTWDATLASWWIHTLGANCTPTFANPPTGRPWGFTVELIQNGTGGFTMTWPASVKWQAGTAPTLITSANTTCILSFATRNAGTTWHGFLSGEQMS